MGRYLFRDDKRFQQLNSRILSVLYAWLRRYQQEWSLRHGFVFCNSHCDPLGNESCKLDSRAGRHVHGNQLVIPKARLRWRMDGSLFGRRMPQLPGSSPANPFASLYTSLRMQLKLNEASGAAIDST